MTIAPCAERTVALRLDRVACGAPLLVEGPRTVLAPILDREGVVLA
jgi:hypothetical protein